LRVEVRGCPGAGAKVNRMVNLVARRRTEDTATANAQLVREAYRLRLDGGRVDDTARSIGGFLELLAPEVEFLTANGIWPNCQGQRGVADLLTEAAREWAECSFAVEELRELDETRVLACGTVLARPSGRTEIYEIPFVNLWTIEEGRAIRIESFTDRRQAEAAVALSLGDPSGDSPI
jgi:ketosteroid isomerase-like protein